MWSYYGSKKHIINYYPPPRYEKIIEPFAGAASYAMKYWNNEVILVEKDDIIANIWKWLQKCSVNDIRKLPRKLERTDHLDSIKFDCIEAKHLMGFLIGKGSQSPRKTPSERAVIARPNTINFSLTKIENNLHKIKHWEIIEGSYEDLDNTEATWFIDPPYQFGGYAYKENKINFESLSSWCKSRNGHVIVCENTKADWMDFFPLIKNKGSAKETTEAIYTNVSTSLGAIQQSLNF